MIKNIPKNGFKKINSKILLLKIMPNKGYMLSFFIKQITKLFNKINRECYHITITINNTLR